MKIGTILVGMLVFSMAMAGMGMFYDSFQSNYNFNGTHLGAYDYSQELNSSTSAMGSSVKSGQTITTGLFPYLDTIISGFKSLLNLGSIANGLITSLNTELSLPHWFIGGIELIITAIVGFAIVSAIWKWYI